MYVANRGLKYSFFVPPHSLRVSYACCKVPICPFNSMLSVVGPTASEYELKM